MPRKTIFLSAVSRELGDRRKLLYEVFGKHFDVITQESTLPDIHPHGIREALAAAIDTSDCVIHLAARGFGSTADKPFPEDPAFRCSWTQYEYYYAHQQCKPVFALTCGPALADPSFEERPDELTVEEKQALQKAHCARVASGRFADTPLSDTTRFSRTSNNREVQSTREHLLKAAISICADMARTDPDYVTVKEDFQEQLAHLLSIKDDTTAIRCDTRTNLRRQILVASVILIVLVCLGIGIVHLVNESRINKENIISMGSKFELEREITERILSRAKERIAVWRSMSPSERFKMALNEIAAEDDIPSKQLSSLLDFYAERVNADPQSDFIDQYNAAMIKGDIAGAETLASNEIRNAKLRKEKRSSVIKAASEILERERIADVEDDEVIFNSLLKEGAARQLAAKFKEALGSYREAATLNPISWEAQNSLGKLSATLGLREEAETALTAALRLSEDTENEVIALSNLGGLMIISNRPDEAEKLLLQSLAISESAPIKNNIDTFYTLNSLAILCQNTRPLDALDFYERAVTIGSVAIGEKHPDFGALLSNFGTLLLKLDRPLEAESHLARSVTIALSSEENPDLANRLYNLSLVLEELGRLDEAESRMREALIIILRFTILNEHEHPQLEFVFKNYALFLKDRGNNFEQAQEKIASIGPEAGWEKDIWEEKYVGMLNKL